MAEENSTQAVNPTQHINGFIGGMYQDMADTSLPNKNYRDGRNIRVVTEEGASSGAVVNMRDVVGSHQIGSANGVFILKPSFELNDQVFWHMHNEDQMLNQFSGVYQNLTETFEITIGGTTYSGDHEYLKTPASICEALDKILTAANPSGVKWFNFGNYIIFNRTFTYNGPGNIFGGSDGTVKVSSQGSLNIIGSAEIRDEIYVFTTNDTSEKGGPGQIWRVDYDRTTFGGVPTATSTLIYNGNLNFSTQHPIEAVGVYENDDVGRITWTDNYNPPRSLNVYHPDAWAFNETILELTPDAQFRDVDIMKVEAGGDLKVGMYKYAYRYVSNNGNRTRFSPLTPWVHVVKGSDGGESPYFLYNKDSDEEIEYNGTKPFDKNGEPIFTDKCVHLSLRRLDPNFDYVEIAALHRVTERGTPEVTIIEKTPIPRHKEVNGLKLKAKQKIDEDPFTPGLQPLNIYEIYAANPLLYHTLDIIHSGREKATQLSYEEFIAAPVVFDTVKSLTVKDNRVFFGNVKLKSLDLTFNARAYRYRKYADQPLQTYVDNPNSEREDADWDVDAINPWNNSFVDEEWNRYEFQSDGITKGGDGPNVSYKFWDSYVDGNTVLKDPIGPFMMKPNRPESLVSGIYINGMVRPWLAKHWRDFKNPLNNAYCRGYMNGEVYRFGVVLYDKKGNPGFVNWIGDIKMPWYATWYGSLQSMMNNKSAQVPAQNGTLNDCIKRAGVVKSYRQNDGRDGPAKKYSQHVMSNFGIEFDVNIPDNLKANVSGYQIVRVERFSSDRTVLGNGLIEPMARLYNRKENFNDDGGSICAQAADKDEYGNLYVQIANRCENDSWSETNGDCVMGAGRSLHTGTSHAFMYHNPDFHFNNMVYQEGDFMKVEAYYCNRYSDNAKKDVGIRAASSYNNTVDIPRGNLRWDNGLNDDFVRYAVPANPNVAGTRVYHQGTNEEFEIKQSGWLGLGASFEIQGVIPVLPGQKLGAYVATQHDCMTFRNVAGWPQGEYEDNNPPVSIGARGHIVRLRDNMTESQRDIWTDTSAYGPTCYPSSFNVWNANGHIDPWPLSANPALDPNPTLADYRNGSDAWTNTVCTFSENYDNGDGVCYTNLGWGPLIHSQSMTNSWHNQFHSRYLSWLGYSTVEMYSWDFTHPVLALHGAFPVSNPNVSAGDRIYRKTSCWYLRPIQEQYGGNTKEARSRNTYISCGKFTALDDIDGSLGGDFETLTNFNSLDADIDGLGDYSPTDFLSAFGIYPSWYYNLMGMTVTNDYDKTEFNITTDVRNLHFGGDTYSAMYGQTVLERNHGFDPSGHQVTNYEDPADGDNGCGYVQDGISISHMWPVKTTFNVDMRRGYHFLNKPSTDVGLALEGQRSLQFDEYEFEGVYSTENNLLSFSPKPLDAQLNEEFDVRVHYSEAKINGETVNSWSYFKPANYKDVDSIYGQINKVIAFKDNVYALQDTAIGGLAINPVAMITPENTGSALVLGTGQVIQDVQYLSDEAGTIHQWSVVKSEQSIYWYDAIGHKLCRIGAKGVEYISTTKGLKGYFHNNFHGDLRINDNILGTGRGVVAGFDAENSEILFTFRDSTTNTSATGTFNVGMASAAGSEITYTPAYDPPAGSDTLIFSENIDAFSTFFDHMPYHYLSTRDKLISIHTTATNDLAIHNEGNRTQSGVEVIVNSLPQYTKVFDTLEWHTDNVDYTGGSGATGENGTTLNEVNFVTPIASSLQPVGAFIRRETTWKVPVGRDDRDNVSRLRHKTMRIRAIINAGSRVILHYLRTYFRISSR